MGVIGAQSRQRYDEGRETPAERIHKAIGLTPAQRREVVEAFFQANPGMSEAHLGLGRAVLDFQSWEISSGRIADRGGSSWWRAVNGMMVLDIHDAMNASSVATCAVDAWRAYASAGGGTQASLWEAHQWSLHSAIRSSRELLGYEPPPEQAFAAIAIDVVDRTALAGRPTDSPALAAMTKRFYPACYPIDDAALAPLVHMRDRTVERVRGADGMVFVDVGIHSRRWS